MNSILHSMKPSTITPGGWHWQIWENRHGAPILAEGEADSVASASDAALDASRAIEDREAGRVGVTLADLPAGRRAKCCHCPTVMLSAESLPMFSLQPKQEFDSFCCGCGNWD